MDKTLASGRLPSLRRRLLFLVSTASLISLTLAAWLSYQQARHEVQELMDGQMTKTAQLLLAQTMAGEDRLRDLPSRLTRIRDVPPIEDVFPLEYQIGRLDGTLVVRSPQAPVMPLSGALGFANLQAADQDWRSLLVEVADPGYRIQITQSIPARNGEALEIASRTLEPLALIFPLSLLAIYLSVRRGLKPLDEVAAAVVSRSSDNLSPLTRRGIPREVQPLVAAINRLMFRLGAVLERERRFTADAAHELRTPLAAARIQAQVALLSLAADKRDHALTQTLAGLDRASRLVEQLLRLARLDPLAQVPHAYHLDLARLAQGVAATTLDLHPEACIQLDLDMAGERATIMGDADLIDIALRNLLDNAIRYTPPGTEITLWLRADEDGLRLGVRDGGPGVAISDLPLLTKRFYRGQAVRAEGSGLGLAIVARIAELHGARLELRNREEAGRVLGFEACLHWA